MHSGHRATLTLNSSVANDPKRTSAVHCGNVFDVGFWKMDACEGKAVGKDGKPLAGAAKNSFMTKCQKGA
jgi:hypothetical protein